MSNPAIDVDGIKRRLAVKGQLVYLGSSATSCVMSLQMASGRVVTSHRRTEAECLADIEAQVGGDLL